MGRRCSKEADQRKSASSGKSILDKDETKFDQSSVKGEGLRDVKGLVLGFLGSPWSRMVYK
jgi:hypothetical protein